MEKGRGVAATWLKTSSQGGAARQRGAHTPPRCSLLRPSTFPLTPFSFPPHLHCVVAQWVDRQWLDLLRNVLRVQGALTCTHTSCSIHAHESREKISARPCKTGLLVRANQLMKNGLSWYTLHSAQAHNPRCLQGGQQGERCVVYRAMPCAAERHANISLPCTAQHSTQRRTLCPCLPAPHLPSVPSPSSPPPPPSAVPSSGPTWTPHPCPTCPLPSAPTCPLTQIPLPSARTCPPPLSPHLSTRSHCSLMCRCGAPVQAAAGTPPRP